MINLCPGFCVGEMLDWEAPLGATDFSCSCHGPLGGDEGDQYLQRQT